MLGNVLAAGLIASRRRRKEPDPPLSVYDLVRAGAAAGPQAKGALDLGMHLDERATAEVDIWQKLAPRVDPAEWRPQLADDIERKFFKLKWGNNYGMLANPRDLIHYQLEPAEFETAGLMDGTRTIADIVVERLQDSGDLDVEAVAYLARALHDGGFLEPRPTDVYKAVRARLEPPSQARFRKFLKTLMLEWRGADGFVRSWYEGGFRFFFLPPGALLATIVSIAGMVAFIVVQSSGRYHLEARSAPIDTLIIILLGLPLTFAHEISHASAIVHNGRRVKSAGIMLYFGSPAFFVDASDGLMSDRFQRVLQAFAGPFAEMALAGVASIVLLLLPSGSFANLMYKFAVLNYLVIFLNLIPLLELDGYFVLADLIQVPDLRPRSLEFMQHDLWHKLRSRERFKPQEVGLGLYGIAGIAFTIFSVYTALFFWREIFGGLVSALWHGGLWEHILLLLLLIVFLGPVIRGLITALRALWRRLVAVERKISFKLETSWRVEAAELIDALPAFEDLPEDLLSDLAGRVRLRTFHPGQPVFRQGDRASAFYVVRKGTLTVEEEDPESGNTRVLHTLKRGESFGELGLLQSAPRTATVRAVDTVEIFEVDKGTFDRLLADEINAPTFLPTLQALAELREHPAFAHLTVDELSQVLVHGSWTTAPPGAELIRQGEPGDAFYAVGSGQADVVRDGQVLKTAGRGDYFGEIALLQDVPRTASVIARTPLRVFRLDREGFDQLISGAFRGGTLKLTADRTWQH